MKTANVTTLAFLEFDDFLQLLKMFPIDYVKKNKK